MTNDELIIQVRNMTGDSVAEDSDYVLSTFLNVAAENILSRLYPYDTTKTEVPERYQMLQCEIAVYLLNKRGAEGETTHTESNISRQYESADIPASMLRRIVPYSGVI